MVKDLAFPVGQPLLEDLVAAQLVVPNGGRDVPPAGAVVQLDVDGGVAEDDGCFALGLRVVCGCWGSCVSFALAVWSVVVRRTASRIGRCCG